MKKVTWTVGGTEKKEQIERIPLISITEDANEHEKESTRMWNLMVTTLRANGLMKD